MILDEIVELTKIRVETELTHIPIQAIKNLAMERQLGPKFIPAITPFNKEEIRFICEVKKASPSKGIISEKFDFIQIARDYEYGGASAISVLTEPTKFLGSMKHLQKVCQVATVPVLMKDFIVSTYQIYQARISGASAILLICAVLTDEELVEFLQVTRSIGLSALVETHDEEEVHRAIKAGADIIGVNNRDLKTFHVDINTCIELRKLVPPEIVFVAESGIKTREDIIRLTEAKVDAVLIGETLMRAANKIDTLEGLMGKGFYN